MEQESRSVCHGSEPSGLQFEADEADSIPVRGMDLVELRKESIERAKAK